MSNTDLTKPPNAANDGHESSTDLGWSQHIYEFVCELGSRARQLQASLKDIAELTDGDIQQGRATVAGKAREATAEAASLAEDLDGVARDLFKLFQANADLAISYAEDIEDIARSLRSSYRQPLEQGHAKHS